MGIEQFHSASRVWHYVEDGEFSMEFQSLENYFNERAREEEVITEKQYIHLKEVEVDPKNRVINLKTELYRLLEN